MPGNESADDTAISTNRQKNRRKMTLQANTSRYMISEPSHASPPAQGKILKVLLVDDHPAFRSGIAAVVRNIDGFEVCGEAADGTSALEASKTLTPDLVILDITLPDLDGLEVTKQIVEQDPPPCVLVLSMHDDSLYAVKALKAGARGYIRKDDALADLATAMRETCAGNLYLSPKFKDYLIYRIVHSRNLEGDSLVHDLSERELQVFEALGEGLSTRRIAEKLNLSTKTIETYRSHIKRKLLLADAESTVRLAKEWSSLQGMELAG